MDTRRNLPLIQSGESNQRDNSRGALAGAIAKEGYEAHVALEALERAGHCPQLKGHVHEIMFRDKFNFNPLNLLRGQHAELSSSATDTVMDVVIKKAGKIVDSAQLKDTVSRAGVKKTVAQIQSGKYIQTTVVGTKETVKKIADKVTQEVQSSGISTETTSRIANKALGKIPSLSAIGSAVKAGGIAGAAVSAGIEAVSSAVDVVKGIKDLGDAASDVAKAGVKGGIVGASTAAVNGVVAGATGSAVGVLAATGIGGAIAATGAGAVVMSAAPVVVGFGAACVAGSAVSSLIDKKLKRKEPLNLCIGS